MDAHSILLFGLIGLVSFVLSYYGSAVGLILGHLRLPLLVYCLPTVAAGMATSLITSGLGALTGTIRHAREGRISVQLIVLMGVPSIAGAFLGARFLVQIDSSWARLALGGFLVFSGVNLFVSRASENQRALVFGKLQALVEVVIGLGLGFLSTLTGLMLGSLRLPLIIRCLKIDPRVAVGSNMAIGCLTAFAGAASLWQQGGNLFLVPLLIIGPPTILGGYLGARLTGRVRKESLQRLVGATIVLTGLYMSVEGVWKNTRWPASPGDINEVALAPVAYLEETSETVEPAIDFNRDIRPILSNHCFSCHGPDGNKRKAGLRLDRRDDALAELRSGGHAIVPGDRAASELHVRITSNDERERMPPVKTGKKLSAAQIALLGKWIDQGAKWDAHWSYLAPRRPPLPLVKNRAWPRNPIDYFILERLEKEGLQPSGETDRSTLIRRLSFDLTGLPPTLAEVEAFSADASRDAYEKVVDRLLASPYYGERMAQHWLDLARYADTNGYRLDNHRDMWPFRDWVIDAFNQNMPFDQFTVEQLAGDMLPDATVAQKIATGFHRNTMVNFGNGSDPEEYRAKAVMDRVSTTATVWLGSTLACAQCHDHKYDPFTQKDFFRFYAFFNNVPEKGLDGDQGNPVPTIMDPKSAIPAMVMEEMPAPRQTRIFLNGDMHNPGEVVTAGVPAHLPPLPPDAPANRLGLARWLVDPGHPLTSRVAVNRLWQLHFGAGLVKTSDDFGSQGEMPSHAELLDWLAVEFVARGWDVKAMQKLVVMSATYRQASQQTPQLRDGDPHNRLLARGSRLRLDAEVIRDSALAVSGLLQPRIGGPSVRPYQPPGLWEQVALGGNYTSQTYVQSEGEDLYRRGVYVYVKRSMPYPSLTIFDAPDREACTMKRPRTNTPLQALVLLNDPAYVEAARVLAQRVLREVAGADPAQRLIYAFRLCTSRTPTTRELEVLTRVYEQQRVSYREDPNAAEELVSAGASSRRTDFNPFRVDVTELAAWTAVANLLLNLDETITRE